MEAALKSTSHPHNQEVAKAVVRLNQGHAVTFHPDQIAFPDIVSESPVTLEEGAVTILTSATEDNPRGGAEFKVYATSLDPDTKHKYPALAPSFLHSCAATADIQGQITQSEFLAWKTAQHIVDNNVTDTFGSRTLFVRYVVNNGLNFDPETRVVDEDVKPACKIGILFPFRVDKTRGSDGIADDGRVFVPGEDQPIWTSKAALVFAIRPGVDETHDPSFDETQGETASILPALQERQPLLFNVLSAKQKDWMQSARPDLTNKPCFAKFMATTLDIKAEFLRGRADHPDPADEHLRPFNFAFHKVSVEEDGAVRAKWTRMPRINGKEPLYGAIKVPSEDSPDHQVAFQICECIRTPDLVFDKVKIPANMSKAMIRLKEEASKAELKALQHKLNLAQEHAKVSRERAEDAEKELEEFRAAAKYAKRGDVVVVADGCHLVTPAGAETVFLTAQGPDKNTPVALNLPRDGKAQIFIPAPLPAVPF